MKRSHSIDSDVLDVLAKGSVSGLFYYLPPGQLERKLYTRTNKVLEALGGTWDKGSKAHVFQADPAAKLAAVLATGSYDNPKVEAFFPTPTALASRIVTLAGVQPHHRVLEPSAGTGALVLALRRAGVMPQQVTCFEINEERCQELRKLNADVVQGDFLASNPLCVYDVVVMNPPFTVPGRWHADIDHVTHAVRCLKPGGKLVSVMSASVLMRGTSKTADFRQMLDDASSGWSIFPLPDKSFAESGTMVRTALLTFTKATR